jgi:RNA polymerase sigma-70 factor (ECF subfamily)
MSGFKILSFFGSTDEQAMHRVQTCDDEEAFTELVRRWRAPIERLCTRMLGDVHRGEDLAQETFSKLYRGRKTYRGTGKFSTFLWQVAVNSCYDELRKLKCRPECSLEGINDPDGEGHERFQSEEPSPDETVVSGERAQTVRTALQGVPDIYRCVLILRHYENLKFREIANVLEIPEGTVKSRMAEGLELLSKTLQRQDKLEFKLCKNITKRRLPEANLI